MQPWRRWLLSGASATGQSGEMQQICIYMLADCLRKKKDEESDMSSLTRGTCPLDRVQKYTKEKKSEQGKCTGEKENEPDQRRVPGTPVETSRKIEPQGAEQDRGFAGGAQLHPPVGRHPTVTSLTLA